MYMATHWLTGRKTPIYLLTYVANSMTVARYREIAASPLAVSLLMILPTFCLCFGIDYVLALALVICRGAGSGDSSVVRAPDM